MLSKKINFFNCGKEHSERNVFYKRVKVLGPFGSRLLAGGPDPSDKVIHNIFFRCYSISLGDSPSTYSCQSVSGSVSAVGDSFRFGDSYRISELCELVEDAIASPGTNPCQ